MFFSLTAATMLNISQVLLKPQEKYRKWFLLGGLANLLSSVILGGYGIYHMCDLYTKVPESEWERIKVEKENYEKLSFS